MIKERVINNLVESIVSKSEVEDSIKRRKGEKKKKKILRNSSRVSLHRNVEKSVSASIFNNSKDPNRIRGTSSFFSSSLSSIEQFPFQKASGFHDPRFR